MDSQSLVVQRKIIITIRAAEHQGCQQNLEKQTCQFHFARYGFQSTNIL